MKKTTFQNFLYTLIFILVFGFVSTVSAHGTEPRLEISTDHMNSGGVVDVRGVDFEREEVVTLMLVNNKTSIPFGEIIADIEGVFSQTIVLPVDLAEGTYNFLAITDDHKVFSPGITIPGPPILDSNGGYGEGVREEEPLLAPMPTFAPNVVPGEVAQSTSQPASESTRITASQSPIAIVLIALLIAGAPVALGLRGMRKK